MKAILSKIERASDGTYSIYAVDDLFSGAGDTLSDAKKNMMEGIKLYVDVMKEDGRAFPEYLEEGNYEIKYSFSDIQTLLNYYEGILGFTALERLTGISNTALWSYARGKNKPRLAQKTKIVDALHNLGEELISIAV